MKTMQRTSTQPEPAVGMGATRNVGSDRYAGTIIAIKKNAKGKVTGFTYQEDTATRTDNNGMSDSQAYTYARNPDGEKIEVSLRRNGRWVTVGHNAKNGIGFSINHRGHFHDYSF